MLDWDPNDPDAVKVHYDVTTWNVEQRAELSAALADDDIPHVWAGDELVVPEELEQQTDAVFARLEDELGPFPILLGDDEPSVEYGLDEWPDEDRDTLTTSLVEAGIPHRWDGTTVFVAEEAEATVDELLDGIELGEIGQAVPPPEDALARLFAAADRLAKDPDDRIGREDLAVLAAACDPVRPPYGLDKGAWRGVVEATRRVAIASEAAEPVPSDVIGAAQQLRSLVRPYV